MAKENPKDIKQIKIGEDLHDIDALKWGGHTFEEVKNLIHGVVDTYVIPEMNDNDKTSDYTNIVESSKPQVSTTISKLKSLVSNPPSNEFDSFNVGDIILMGATSDGKTNFDRWISAVNGDNITLDVLETQVATHYHKITPSKSTALTGVSVVTPTSVNMAKVDTSVKVLTGITTSEVSSGWHFLTTVGHTGGSYTFTTSSKKSNDGVGHSHTVQSHSHNVSVTPHATFVSTMANVYGTLTSDTYTPHKHTTVSVAGEATSDEDNAFTYVTGKSATNTFIKTLTSSTQTTSEVSFTTSANGGSSLYTATQTSGDEIGDVVSTMTDGSHNHSITLSTTGNFVQTVSVAPSVVTSVSFSYTRPSVAPTVVTSVSCSTKQANTVASWKCSVDDSGILSFELESSSRVTSVAVSAPYTSQTSGNASINAPRVSQSYTSSVVTLSGNTSTVDGHSHGFSHTHSIPSHTHTIASHTHTYDMTIVSETGSAITSLSTSTYTPHKHTSVSVASPSISDETITFVTGGTLTSVVANLVSSASLTAADSGSTTDTQYYEVSIIYPGLSCTGKTFTSKNITPAADSGETPVVGITFTSDSFIKDVDTITTINFGGDGKEEE